MLVYNNSHVAEVIKVDTFHLVLITVEPLFHWLSTVSNYCFVHSDSITSCLIEGHGSVKEHWVICCRTRND